MILTINKIKASAAELKTSYDNIEISIERLVAQNPCFLEATENLQQLIMAIQKLWKDER